MVSFFANICQTLKELTNKKRRLNLFVIGFTLAQIGPMVPTTVNPTPYYTAEPQAINFPFISIIIIVLIITIILGVGLLFAYLYAKTLKKEDGDVKSMDYVLYLARVPKDNEFSPKVMEQLFSSFHGIVGKRSFLEKLVKAEEGISFEIIAYPNYLGFYIYMPKKFAHLVEKQILGAYQDAEILEVPEPNIFKEGSVITAAEFKLSDKDYYPIKTYVEAEEKSDALTNIAGAFANMVEGEGGALQVLIVPTDLSWAKAGQKLVKKQQQLMSDPEKKGKANLTQVQMDAILKKTSKIGFKVYIRAVVSAETDLLAQSRLTSLSGAFSQLTNPGLNSFKMKKVPKKHLKEFMHEFIYRKVPLSKASILNVEELATIYHFPNKHVQTPGIDWLLAKKAPPPQNLPTSGTWIGTSVYRGVKKPVYIGSVKDRMRHMYIIGQTGVGKSYFMANIILQDIYAGRGLAVLDPHGSLIEEIIYRIPPERAEDVIYFNPANRDRPFGLNILEHRNEHEKHEVVNGFLALMKKMFDPHDQGIVGPRFERAVRMAMLTVMADPKSTLVEVLRALADEDFAKSFLPKIKDDEVRRYWEVEQANTDKFHKSEILGWITSKFDRFVTNILIRNIIGQSKSSFDVRDVMDNGKILLINLSQGLIGVENAQFLGLILVPKIMRAALSREDTPEDQRRDFFLYVDEFQNFATEDFAKILSEARKYKLGLVVANQYIAQMQEKVRDAIFGNVGNQVAFRVGATDAEYLEKEFAPVFSAQDLIKLENANAYVKLLIDGFTAPPFSISTFFNINKRYPKYEKVGELIKKLSFIKYGMPIEQVNKDIEIRAKGLTEKKGADKTPVSKPPMMF